MATKDLVNEITPAHPRRPVKTRLSALRAAITDADATSKYSAEYLGRCNYNDLVAIARSLNVTLPL